MFINKRDWIGVTSFSDSTIHQSEEQGHTVLSLINVFPFSMTWNESTRCRFFVNLTRHCPQAWWPRSRDGHSNFQNYIFISWRTFSPSSLRDGDCVNHFEEKQTTKKNPEFCLICFSVTYSYSVLSFFHRAAHLTVAKINNRKIA